MRWSGLDRAASETTSVRSSSLLPDPVVPAMSAWGPSRARSISTTPSAVTPIAAAGAGSRPADRQPPATAMASSIGPLPWRSRSELSVTAVARASSAAAGSSGSCSAASRRATRLAVAAVTPATCTLPGCAGDEVSGRHRARPMDPISRALRQNAGHGLVGRHLDEDGGRGSWRPGTGAGHRCAGRAGRAGRSRRGRGGRRRRRAARARRRCARHRRPRRPSWPVRRRGVREPPAPVPVASVRRRRRSAASRPVRPTWRAARSATGRRPGPPAR